VTEADNDAIEQPEVILDIDDLNRLQAQKLNQRVRDALDNQTDAREASLAIVDLLDEDPRSQDEWTPPQHAFYMAALCGCLAQSSGFESAIANNGPWMHEVMQSIARMNSEIGIFLFDELRALLPGNCFPTDDASGAAAIAAWTPQQHQKLKELESKFADYAADQMLLDMASFVSMTIDEWV
jgi:hypothetical protein